MYGVALEVDKDLRIFNLTHDITPYNIWEASYRLYQSVEYWPKGTVFVSVVDPGVGSSRKSVVAKTSQGQFIVTPDNGTLTHIHKNIGIVSIREIDETRHRRQNTEFSYTFHGRDVYANTGAKLASGKISFEEVGPELPIEKILELPCGEVVVEEKSVSGCIDILDVRFGSLWTNVPREDFKKIGAEFGDRIEVTIYNNAMLVYQNYIMYGHSFADVRIGEPIIYVNSLYRMAVAINQGSFAKAYNIGTGNHWKIVFRKISD
jgi:S-adenosylmethionine hydrolase